MAFEGALILANLFKPAALLTTREWKPLTEGVFISAIYETENQGARAALLHYMPGASVPNHRHMGFEHILILDGWQKDGAVIYEAGTLVVHAPGSQHNLVAPEGCLALGIWEKPVAFV